MPRRKRSYARRRRSRRKRTYKKRRRNYVSRFVPSGIPASRVSRMRFVHSANLLSAGDTLVSTDISANSIYNPLLTSLNNKQPLGFDQMSTLFNRYMVVGSRARVIFNQQADTRVAWNCWVGVHLTDADQLVPYTNHEGYIEAKKGTYTQLISQRNQARTLYCNFSPKGWFNVTDLKDNAELGSVVTGNPEKQAQFHLWQQHINSETTSQRNEVQYTIIIDYMVLWSEPAEIARS